MHPPASFVPFIMHLRILSFLFFLSALHRFRLPVAFPTPCARLSAPADLPLSPCLVSHTVLPVLLIQLAVRFLSLFPASLPQLFHRCLPFAFAFGIFLFPSASFRPLLFRFQLLGFLFLPFPASWPRLSVCFSSASVLPFGFPVFHHLFRLVSHASFPVFGTWLSVGFLSSFPVSLPQLLYRCFPF